MKHSSDKHLPVTETGKRKKWDNENLGSNMRKIHPVISYRLYIEDNEIIDLLSLSTKCTSIMYFKMLNYGGYL